MSPTPIDSDIEPQRREIRTGTDGVVPFERVGQVKLEGHGSLDLWWLDSYGGGIFLPLHDATSGVTTYGAGRYLLDTTKGQTSAGTRAASWWTSTSRISRRAPTTRRGPVLFRERETGLRQGSPWGRCTWSMREGAAY